MKHYFAMSLTAIILITSSIFSLRSYGRPLDLRTEQDGTDYRVKIVLDGEDVLNSPPEGLWSIATEWKNSWPASWIHAGPTEIEHVGDWTILRGKLETAAGTWRLSDSYRPDGNVIKCIRRFIWDGTAPAKFVTLSVRYQCRGRGSKAVLPGILYHGNPSVQKAAGCPFTQASRARRPSMRSTVFRCPTPAWNGLPIAACRERRSFAALAGSAWEPGRSMVVAGTDS